jgi:hypothetical protein
MDILHIEKFQARYHLSPVRVGQKDRLDRLLSEVLDGSLALAMDRLEIPSREEICIRRVVVPVRLKMEANDRDLSMDWSMALANHFSDVISRNDPSNVIRFPSRFHGVIDFAEGVARGDLQRAWAWKQIGLLEKSWGGSLMAAAEGLVSNLIRESVWIVPTLSQLTRSGWIYHLLVRLPVVWWQDLATAALMEYNRVMPTLIVDEPKDAANGQERIAARIIRASSLAAVVDQKHEWFSNHVDLLPVWSIFVILETEPAVYLAEPQEALLVQAAVEQEIRRKAGVAKPTHRSFSVTPRRAATSESAADSHSPHQIFVSGAEQHTPTQLPQDQKETFGQQQVERIWSQAVETDAFVTGVEQHISTQLQQSQKETIDQQQVERIWNQAVETDGTFLERSHGVSEYGGLLFLLPLLEQVGVVDDIINAEQFSNHSLRWFLHVLALQLISMQADDPAALAFCGLRPDDPMPGKDEPGLDQTEKRLVADWRLRIVKRLADLMNVNEQRKQPEWILQKVCCRNAKIMADPGWIDVIFSIREVVTEVRRAGLDLDPGFIPWLGVVIKFYYE